MVIGLTPIALSISRYCTRYGIEITQEQWPSVGIPTEIITDQGREFFGPRMSELCRRYGLEVLTLPPFRPDQKGTVEKSIDLLQQRYKPLLRGKGVIEDDAQERWATDYRMQATLDLDDFTRIVIHSILYLNSGRILDDKTPAERWLELSPRLMAVNPQELHIQTLPRDTAKLTRKGIRVNRMWYAPDGADGLTIGNVYTIAYDPSDLRCIYIILADRICPCHATVEHLTKYYGDHLAVNDLSFEINEGHVYGFLGPNGAGKSTTMNIMTGCLSATAGSVRIDGYDIFEEPEKAKRLIGYLPEQPPLYMNESPLDYLRFVGEAKGLRGAALNGQIQEVICQTGIAPVAHRRISDLSKGYKQRVGIAQALLGNPRVIILDEPTVGLDPIQIIEIRDLIRTLGENHTVIFSSHILSEVQTICDQILMIAHGKLVAFGPPDELEKQFSAAGELEITADADLQELRRVLSTVELLSEITTTVLPSGYGKASVKSAHGDLYAVSGAVFRACADAGVTLLEMRLKKANLEDVFLELASAGEEPSAGAAGAREQPSEDAGEGEVPEK